MIYAAPDTNVFLHYKHFGEIPWSDLLGEQTTLTILPAVFGELEKKKYDSADSRIKRRAGTVSDAIYKKRKDGSVRLVLSTDLPGGLNSQVQSSDVDLHILAEARALQEMHPEDRVVIVTADNGMKVKAEIGDIPFFEIPDELKLPDDDERDRELQKTRNELNSIKNEIPEVVLEFDNGTTRITFPPVATKPPEGGELESLAQEHATPIATKAKPMVMEEDYDEKWTAYEAAYDKYTLQFQYYLLFQWLHENRVFELSLALRNVSAVRADDIEVRLHFPDGFKVLETIEVPREPEAPDPPLTIGQMVVAFGKGSADLNLADAFRVPNYFTDFTPKPSLDITEGNSSHVKYHLLSLKQRSRSQPITMYLQYKVDPYPKSFTIESEVLVGNGRDTRNRNLHVIFQ